jgi:hypothetical protein
MKLLVMHYTDFLSLGEPKLLFLFVRMETYSRPEMLSFIGIVMFISSDRKTNCNLYDYMYAFLWP